MNTKLAEYLTFDGVKTALELRPFAPRGGAGPDSFAPGERPVYRMPELRLNTPVMHGTSLLDTSGRIPQTAQAAPAARPAAAPAAAPAANPQSALIAAAQKARQNALAAQQAGTFKGRVGNYAFTEDSARKFLQNNAGFAGGSKALAGLGLKPAAPAVAARPGPSPHLALKGQQSLNPDAPVRPAASAAPTVAARPAPGGGGGSAVKGLPFSRTFF